SRCRGRGGGGGPLEVATGQPCPLPGKEGVTSEANMITEPGFLRAIASQPDDDAPRLIYADWLEEHNEPERAEVIRAQVELARSKADSPHRRRLAFRAGELLRLHEERWVGPLRIMTPDWQFCRGFVEKLVLLPGDLEEEARALFASLPLRRLGLADL